MKITADRRSFEEALKRGNEEIDGLIAEYLRARDRVARELRVIAIVETAVEDLHPHHVAALFAFAIDRLANHEC